MIARVSPAPLVLPQNARRWPNRAPAEDQVSLFKDLVCHWRMYDSEGELLDLQGNPPAYTLLGGTPPMPTFAFTGQVSSYSAAFNGSQSLFTNSQTGAPYNPGTSFTWRVRCKLTSTAATRTMLRYGTAATPIYELYFSHISQRFQFRVLDQNNFSAVARADTLGAPVAGDWYCLVCTFNAQTRVISISGYRDIVDHLVPVQAVRDTSTLSAAMVTTTNVLLIGQGRPGGVNGDFWLGNLSHFLFYKRLLTAAEEKIIVGYDYAMFRASFANGPNDPQIATAPSGLVVT